MLATAHRAARPRTKYGGPARTTEGPPGSSCIRSDDGNGNSATPPKAPTNLTAQVSGGNIVLTWNQPADKTVTGYLILRRRPSDGERQLQV